MILPSKKVLSVFVLTGALVAATIIAFGKDKAGAAINYASNLVAGEKVSVPENPNWQNELSDVAPLSDQTQSSDTASQNSGEENTTDTVSTALVSNYLALKQNGTLDQESAQKLIDQAASYVENSSFKKITAAELNIIPDNGKQTIADYGENLGNILRNNRPKEVKNEMQIVGAAVSSEDSSKINELDGIIVIYEKIANELTKMPVPRTFVKAHLDMVNSTNGMISAFKMLKEVSSDPIKGLVALQLYQNSTITLSQAVNATVTFIKQNNIVYKQGSGGYYLFYGI